MFNDFTIINTITFISKALNKIKLSSFTKPFDKIKERIIFSKIKKLDSSASMISTVKKMEGNIIWTVWLQGEDQAPDLVKACINKMKVVENTNTIVVTLKNVSNYLDLDKNILEKYHQGSISNTAFSEIIRIELLCTYGGLWLDATMYIGSNNTLNLPFSKNFFSLKGKESLSSGEVLGLFPMFCLFSKHPNYPPLLKVRSILIKYWKEYSDQIDYFLIDYILKYVYINDKNFMKEIEDCPLIGKDRFLLSEIVCGTANEKKLIDDNIKIYKLNHKKSYLKTISNMRVYNKILSGKNL